MVACLSVDDDSLLAASARQLKRVVDDFYSVCEKEAKSEC